MLKEASIQKLIYENAVPELDIVLKPQGFKYLKSKSCFVKQSGIFQHIIHVSHPTSALDYDGLCCMAMVNHHNLHKKSTGIANFEIAKPPKSPPYGLQCYAKITLFYPS